MSDIATTLKECHAIVWRYREQLKDVWPTPNIEDCLLFAFCELGESIDAYLRLNSTYERNNEKNLSALDELADVSLMLLTALGPNYVMEWDLEFPEDEPSHDWSSFITNMTLAYEHRWRDWGYTECLVARIATFPFMDLPARLTSRLERIKAKRMPQQEVA